MKLPRFMRRRRPHLYELLNPVGNCAVDRLDEVAIIEHGQAEPVAWVKVDPELDGQALAELARPALPPDVQAEVERFVHEAPGPLLGRLPARWPGSGAPMTWDGLPVTQGPNGELYVSGPWPPPPAT